MNIGYIVAVSIQEPPQPTQFDVRAYVAGEILALMGRNRVTQEALAGAIGMSQPALSKRLRCRQAFDVDELDRLARYFNKPITDLLPQPEQSGWIGEYANQPHPRVPAAFESAAA